MMKVRSIVGLVMSAATILSIATASGQAYPAKTIRIVTSEPGGGSDLTSRLLAQGLTGPLGQPVIVDNRAGVIVVETVAKAPPDGYTILLSASMWLSPLFQPELSFDPVRDFLPIALAVSTPNILVIHPSLPVKSVKDLIALAKSRPGELNYATGTTGSASHIAAEKFKSMAGVNMMRIPYKNAGPGITAWIGGQVQIMFATAGSITPHIKAGKLRPLGVTSPKPSALLPDLPIVAATGLRGYDANTLFGLFAPAKTPADIINRLNQEIVRYLSRAEAREKLLSVGVEPSPSSVEQWAAMVKADMDAVSKIIKSANLRVN